MAEEELDEGFADRIRSGLEVSEFKWAVMVQAFNLAILLIFYTYYCAWTAWLRAKNDFLTVLPFAILILLGIEYILTTAVKERRKEKGTHVFRPVGKDSYSRDGRLLHATGSIDPLHLKVGVSLLLSMVLGVFVLGLIETNKPKNITLNPDGTATMLVQVDETKIEPVTKPVWAVIKTSHQPSEEPLFYVTPVSVEGSYWTLSVSNKEFVRLNDYWNIDFYVNPHNQLTPDRVVSIYPRISFDSQVTCTVTCEALSVTDISYVYLSAR